MAYIPGRLPEIGRRLQVMSVTIHRSGGWADVVLGHKPNPHEHQCCGDGKLPDLVAVVLMQTPVPQGLELLTELSNGASLFFELKRSLVSAAPEAA